MSCSLVTATHHDTRQLDRHSSSAQDLKLIDQAVLLQSNTQCLLAKDYCSAAPDNIFPSAPHKFQNTTFLPFPAFCSLCHFLDTTLTECRFYTTSQNYPLLPDASHGARASQQRRRAKLGAKPAADTFLVQGLASRR